MELIEIFRILRKGWKQLAGIIIGALALSLVWQTSQAPNFEATLLLNVGRNGTQATTEYTYDSFYRLQADERFADTIVRWLGSPRVVEDIYHEANHTPERELEKIFQAGRLSSQVIEVRSFHSDVSDLRKIAESVPIILNRYTETLNRDNREKNWFVIIASEPVVRDARVPISTALLVGLAVGLFLGFWSVILRHYVSTYRKTR